MDYSTKVITTLNHKLTKLDNSKFDLELINNNGFTGKPKKLSFIEDMKIIMSMSPSTYKVGLFDYFNYDKMWYLHLVFFNQDKRLKKMLSNNCLNMLIKHFLAITLIKAIDY